jgi:hypothetical protein
VLSSRDLSYKLGEVGKQKMLAGFTWPIVARRFHDLFSQVIRRRKAENKQ